MRAFAMQKVGTCYGLVAVRNRGISQDTMLPTISRPTDLPSYRNRHFAEGSRYGDNER